jgi:hypothetical protein
MPAPQNGSSDGHSGLPLPTAILYCQPYCQSYPPLYCRNASDPADDHSRMPFRWQAPMAAFNVTQELWRKSRCAGMWLACGGCVAVVSLMAAVWSKSTREGRVGSGQGMHGASAAS